MYIINVLMAFDNNRVESTNERGRLDKLFTPDVLSTLLRAISSSRIGRYQTRPRRSLNTPPLETFGSSGTHLERGHKHLCALQLN